MENGEWRMENGEDGDNSESIDGKPESQLTEDIGIIHANCVFKCDIQYSSIVRHNKNKKRKKGKEKSNRRTEIWPAKLPLRVKRDYTREEKSFSNK